VPPKWAAPIRPSPPRHPRCQPLREVRLRRRWIGRLGTVHLCRAGGNQSDTRPRSIRSWVHWLSGSCRALSGESYSASCLGCYSTMGSSAFWRSPYLSGCWASGSPRLGPFVGVHDNEIMDLEPAGVLKSTGGIHGGRVIERLAQRDPGILGRIEQTSFARRRQGESQPHPRRIRRSGSLPPSTSYGATGDCFKPGSPLHSMSSRSEPETTPDVHGARHRV
jgi:hypothetical protein